jgi:hypothetical protein
VNQLIYQINNDKDFDEYILKHSSKIPSIRTDLQYIKHPTLASNQAHPTPPAASGGRRTSLQSQAPPAFSLPQNTEPTQSHQQFQPPAQSESVQVPSYQSYNTGGYPQQQQQPQQPPPQQFAPQSQSQLPQLASAPTYSPLAQNPYAQQSPDYPKGPVGQVGAQQSSGVAYNNNNNNNSAPPVNPIFGVTLDELFRRDGSPVPLVVYQCIQAVDLYGLEVEGIYRIPGTSSHIQAMKALFDSDATQVDFRNPEAFQHDVNSVAGLLKQFFRELPDPLLTKDFYTKFIEAARIDDDTMRRDSMHALINALPDPNYATLRAILLHLYRVQQASEVNRMSTANLGICWA